MEKEKNSIQEIIRERQEQSISQNKDVIEFYPKTIFQEESDDWSDDYEEALVAGRFKVGKKIGTGSFGNVFRGYDIVMKQKIAIKREVRETRTTIREAFIMKCLQISRKPVACPELLYDGTTNEKIPKFLVMSLLGYNLSQLHKFCGGKFDFATICKIASEIITRFEELHDHNIIHRDVKPQNFLISRHEGNLKIYICDFGLSGKYVNDNGDHIVFRGGLKPIGTARYASMRVHRGYERSRRDDFEAFTYMLLYLYNGSLPWQGLKLHNRSHKWKLILQVKSDVPCEDLCAGVEPILRHLVIDARSMSFDQRPRYEYWRNEFNKKLEQVLQGEKFVYNWESVRTTSLE